MAIEDEGERFPLVKMPRQISDSSKALKFFSELGWVPLRDFRPELHNDPPPFGGLTRSTVLLTVGLDPENLVGGSSLLQGLKDLAVIPKLADRGHCLALGGSIEQGDRDRRIPHNAATNMEFLHDQFLSMVLWTEKKFRFQEVNPS